MSRDATRGERAGAAPSGAAGPPATAPVTIEYWTMWAQERVDVLRSQVPVLEQRTGDKVNIALVGEFRPKLQAAIVARTPPDALIGEVFSAALYGDQAALARQGLTSTSAWQAIRTAVAGSAQPDLT